MAWTWLDRFLGLNRSEEFAFTVLTLFLVGAQAFISFLLRGWASTRVAGWVGIAACSVVEACFVTAIWGQHLFWAQSQSVLDDRWWMTGWWFALFGSISVMLLAGLKRPDPRWWRWIGIMASCIGVVMMLAGIWLQDYEDIRPFSVTTTVAIVAAYANLMWLISLRQSQHWVRYATFSVACLTAVLINALVFLNEVNTQSHDLIVRGAASGAIITSCGTLALLVLLAFNRRGEAAAQLAKALTITIVCPRCHTRQNAPYGTSRCKACGLRLRLMFDEPKCEHCGYLLHQNTSGQCPECGTRIIEVSEPHEY